MAQAIRPYFIAAPGNQGAQIFEESAAQFEWHRGMSWQVRQRSSLEMAAAIISEHPEFEGEILEVSTKSVNYEVGQALSAFNLTLEDARTGMRYPIENWFQASKRFSGNSLLNDGENYGPYPELMALDPKKAKRFLDTKLSDELARQYEGDPLFDRIQSELAQASFAGFNCLGVEFPTEPKSAFYDCLYIRALSQKHNADLAKELLRYSVFTDIEFNPTKQKPKYNTQARSCAIYVALTQAGLLAVASTTISAFISAVGYQR